MRKLLISAIIIIAGFMTLADNCPRIPSGPEKTVPIKRIEIVAPADDGIWMVSLPQCQNAEGEWHAPDGMQIDLQKGGDKYTFFGNELSQKGIKDLFSLWEFFGIGVDFGVPLLFSDHSGLMVNTAQEIVQKLTQSPAQLIMSFQKEFEVMRTLLQSDGRYLPLGPSDRLICKLNPEQDVNSFRINYVVLDWKNLSKQEMHYLLTWSCIGNPIKTTFGELVAVQLRDSKLLDYVFGEPASLSRKWALLTLDQDMINSYNPVFCSLEPLLETLRKDFTKEGTSSQSRRPGQSTIVISIPSQSAAETSHGAVAGIVRDGRTQSGIANASVALQTTNGLSILGGATYDTVVYTSSDGHYQVDSVPSGQISMTALAEGYRSSTKVVSCSNGRCTTADWDLLAKLVIEGTYATHGEARGVCVSGNYAYVADTSGFYVVDISDITHPRLAGSVSTGSWAEDVIVAEDYAFVADGFYGLQVIDIRQPTSPRVVGSCRLYSRSMSLAMAGKYVYVANGYQGLKIIDVTNPAAPLLAGTFDTPGIWATGVSVSGGFAYVTDSETGLHIVDVRNPKSPFLVGSVDTPGSHRIPGTTLGVTVSGSYAYVSDGNEGVQVVDVSSPGSPSLKAGVALTFAWNSAVLDDELFVADAAGLSVVSVANPLTPALTASIYTGDSRDVALSASGDRAFLADGKNGLRVISISR